MPGSRRWWFRDVLFAFFQYTATGKAIRACGDNTVGALVVGLNVRRLYALTFGIGTACLGAAGAIMLLLVDVHPYLGPPIRCLPSSSSSSAAWAACRAPCSAAC